MRWLLRPALYALYLAAFPVALAFLAWRPFVAELRLREPPAADEITPLGPLSSDVMRQVGSLATQRASSFTRFALAKAPGRRRICAYGDSFTYGDEVPPDLDFPSQLREELAAAGRPDVEVLNFGSPWHGFHQSFLVWQASASAMGCDLLLLGPGGFQPERDTSFNHSDLHSPYYLHARFVQEGGQALLVEVLGHGFRERMERYFAFLPAWRYLRYDRNPPAALRALLPEGRTLANPFYYDGRTPAAEARALQGLLLARMAGAGTPLALLHPERDVVALARPLLASARVAAAELPAWHGFPYRARLGHLSAAGNALVARWFAALLLGAVELPPLWLHAARAPDGLGAATPSAPRLPISRFERVDVCLGDRVLGALTSASTSHWERGRGSPEQFAGTGQRALLLIGAPGVAPVDAAVVPLSTVPRAGAVLALRRWRNGAPGAAEPLGALHRLSAEIAVDWAEVPGIEFPLRHELRWRDPQREGGGAGSAAAERVEFLIDETVALRSADSDPGRLLPGFGQLHQFTALGEARLPQGRAPSAGLYDLVFSRGAERRRVALAEWQQIPLPLPPDPPAGFRESWLR